MARIKGFQRVASSYDVTDIRMAVAALEAVDILAITPGMQLGGVLPHASLALGPIEILVPEADADEAAALLAAINAGTVIPHDQRDLIEDDPPAEPTRRRGLVAKLRNLLGFVLGGVSEPLKGLTVNRRRRD